MADKKKQQPEWFRLDNAAAIFPGQNTNTWSNVFRVTIELKEDIEPEILQQALERVLPRFPGFNVRIRKGLFWYYFEKNPNKAPLVTHDVQNPCHRVKFKENNGFLFKVYYHKKKISVDTFHSITDGHGTAIFISTLAAEYLRLKGYDIPCGKMVYDINEPPKAGEMEDSFAVYATSTGKVKRTDKWVYHAKGTKLPTHLVNVTSGIMSFEELHRITKEKGVTITEFFAAVLLEILCKKQAREEKKQKEVSIQIPIDLRRVYGSETMRNFTICLRVKVDPNLGEYSFDELLRQVSYQLRLANDEKKLRAMITANMGLQENPVMKFLPLVLKDFGIGISFAITAEQTTSSLLTNVGAICLPDEMLQYVEKPLFMPSPGLVNAARCGVATIGDKLVFTFSNVYKESDVERDFFTTLVKMGIHVKIESNRESNEV